MNPKVQEFIDKMKAEQNSKELKEMEELLLSLGLVDENKSKEELIYSDVREYGDNDWKWDEKENKYCKKIQAKLPIKITDEEYQEILKYAPTKKEVIGEIKTEKETPTANTIKSIAKIFLILNIIGGIILFIILIENQETVVFAWISIATAIIYSLLLHPLIIGFSKIVKAAEKQL